MVGEPDIKHHIDWDEIENSIEKCLHILYDGKHTNSEIDMIVTMVFRYNLAMQMTPLLNDKVVDSVLARIMAAGAQTQKTEYTDKPSAIYK